ncbi:MAG: peptidase S10 [Acidobacteria bacterium]|nr:peptidase S10 [Acidobacteriota bacterium]
MIAATLFSALLLFQTPLGTPVSTPSPKPVVPAEVKEEVPEIRKHSLLINGRALNYTTTTGFMPIRNPQTGETEARLFFIAYTLDGVADGAQRPLMFSFNGGPGSASVWLHLGALGPKRVKMLDDGLMPPPPYELAANDQTWLTETDLVFIDPVGTGYSRASRPELGSKFWGLNGDIESVGEFIRMYLGRNERWNSPLFLVGESYGTTRASGLSNYLFEKGIALNGICLVSSVLNFQTLLFADGNDLPLVLILPSYTATAWYHKMLPEDLQRKPLPDVLREAETFAVNEYQPALMRIGGLKPAERDALAKRLGRFTGLKPEFIDQNNFRVELGEFNKELLRDRRRTTGRLDSRFTGIDRDQGAATSSFDASMTAIRPPYTAMFNDYARRELGFRSDLEYYILGGGIGAPWNWGTTNGFADTSQTLKLAMSKNPYMKVFVASGYYDMATPYFATEYTLAALNLDPALKANVSTHYYEAGHMMYIELNSLRKLKSDVARFIKESTRK